MRPRGCGGRGRQGSSNSLAERVESGRPRNHLLGPPAVTAGAGVIGASRGMEVSVTIGHRVGQALRGGSLPKAGNGFGFLSPKPHLNTTAPPRGPPPGRATAPSCLILLHRVPCPLLQQTPLPPKSLWQPTLCPPFSCSLCLPPSLLTESGWFPSSALSLAPPAPPPARRPPTNPSRPLPPPQSPSLS